MTRKKPSTERSPRFHQHYGALSEKVIKLENAYASPRGKGADLANGLLYEWTKTGAISLKDFRTLLDVLAYLWEFDCGPIA